MWRFREDDARLRIDGGELPLSFRLTSTTLLSSCRPIPRGDAISCNSKQVSFNISGFNGAMLSNLAFVFRNILSKKYMVKYKDTIDGINLYGFISIFSLAYMVPLALYMEGPAIWEAGISAASAKVGAAKLWQLISISGITYHLYNQTSYMALTGISAVTFSVRPISNSPRSLNGASAVFPGAESKHARRASEWALTLLQTSLTIRTLKRMHFLCCCGRLETR